MRCITSIRVLPLAMLPMALAMAGCASQPVVRPAPTNAWVDKQMAQSITSIAHSMHTLVILDRGGPIVPPPTPIAMTAAAPVPARTQPLVIPATPTPAVTTAPVAVSWNTAKLNTRVAIHWRGPAVTLIDQLASRIGYHVIVASHLHEDVWPDIVVDSPDTTVRWVLQMISNDLGQRASIVVNVRTRVISLEPGTATP